MGMRLPRGGHHRLQCLGVGICKGRLELVVLGVAAPSDPIWSCEEGVLSATVWPRCNGSKAQGRFQALVAAVELGQLSGQLSSCTGSPTGPEMRSCRNRDLHSQPPIGSVACDPSRGVASPSVASSGAASRLPRWFF